MATHFQQTAWIFPPSTSNTPKRSIIPWRALLGGLLFLTLASAQAASLTPYSAVYQSTVKGIAVSLEQTLAPKGEAQWQLSNRSSLLFADLTESATFAVTENGIESRQYSYDNPLSEKRNSRLHFDWNANTAEDRAQRKANIRLTEHMWDSLSVQVQLRMDLMNGADLSEGAEYPQLVRGKVKRYTIKQTGEEIIETPLGRFNTVKLVQRRPGKDKATHIWLAKDWDYLILRLQRVADNSIEHQIDLESISLDGRSIRPL